jgi:hypothetical protein
MSQHDAEGISGISSDDWLNATDSSGRHGHMLREELDTGVRVMGMSLPL